MSDWKEEARRRRDERQTKVPEPIRAPSRRRPGAWRKKWCRGKVGVPHSPECRSHREVSGFAYAPPSWRILVCARCGKHLDYWFGDWSGRGRFGRKKPQWVTS